MSASVRRAVVTGIGLLTPLGEGVQPTWRALLAGESAIGPLRRYDASSLRTRIGAELAGFDPLAYVAKRALRTMSGEDEIAIAATVLALRDAGLCEEGGSRPSLGPRAALFLGGDKELCRPDGMVTGVLAASRDGIADERRLGEVASIAVSPLFYVEGLQAASLFHISQMFDVRGANCYFAGTADAGAAAVGRAARSIRRGECDLALAGGFADAASWWSMSKMDALGVLSTENEAGPGACRPYDRARSGSVLGSGAAILVLEEAETARARGARVYAELSGVGYGGDGGATITPEPSGRGLAHAIGAALRDGGLAPDRVDYVAAHGCATRQGDLTEARAIRTALGKAAENAAVSSVKPQTGHLVAAAGALNAAVAALALHHGVPPRTLTLADPDPQCRIRHVGGAGPSAAEPGPRAALALARGIAGGQIALALTRHDEPTYQNSPDRQVQISTLQAEELEP